jgi:MFS family permease
MTVFHAFIETNLAPEYRRFALANLVNTIGIGLFVPLLPIYLTRILKFDIEHVTLALGLSAGVSLLVGPLAGSLADAHSATRIYVVVLLIHALSILSFVFVRSFGMLVVVALFRAASRRANGAIVGALISQLRQNDTSNATAARAFLRTVTNVGLSFGAVLSGVVLQVDTKRSYYVAIALSATSFLIAASILYRIIPETVSTPKVITRSTLNIFKFRDHGFIGVTTSCAFMTLNYQVMTFAMPLWLVLKLPQQKWLPGILFALSTLVVIFTQLRVAKRVRNSRDAAASYRFAGMFFLVSCSGFASIDRAPIWLAIIILALAAAAHSLGETYEASGAFGLAFSLAPTNRKGEYEGVFTLGSGTIEIAGPAILGFFCLRLGAVGWVLLGILFFSNGFIVPLVVDRYHLGTLKRS